MAHVPQQSPTTKRIHVLLLNELMLDVTSSLQEPAGMGYVEHRGLLLNNNSIAGWVSPSYLICKRLGGLQESGSEMGEKV
jgi:hypothetical protein